MIRKNKVILGILRTIADSHDPEVQISHISEIYLPAPDSRSMSDVVWYSQQPVKSTQRINDFGDQELVTPIIP